MFFIQCFLKLILHWTPVQTLLNFPTCLPARQDGFQNRDKGFQVKLNNDVNKDSLIPFEEHTI